MRVLSGARQSNNPLSSRLRIMAVGSILMVVAVTFVSSSTASALSLSPVTCPVSKTLDSLPILGSLTKLTDPLLCDTASAPVTTLAKKASPVYQPLKQITNNTPLRSSAPASRHDRHSSNPSTAAASHTTASSSAPASSDPVADPPAGSDDSGPLRALPQAIQIFAGGITGKHINRTALTVATAILGLVLIVFIGAVYRMISRARHGLTTIGHDFATETSFYHRLIAPGAVALGTLGAGSALMYLVLIGL